MFLFNNSSGTRIKLVINKGRQFKINWLIDGLLADVYVFLCSEIQNNTKIIDVYIFFRINLTYNPKCDWYIFESDHFLGKI